MVRIRPWVRMALLTSALGALLATLPLVASADTFRFSGQGAEASFFSSNPEDGSFTSVFVFAVDGTFTQHDPPGGPPQKSQQKTANIFAFQSFPGDPDDPADDRFREIFAFASPVDLQVARQLSSATLEATVPAQVCEFSGGREPPEPPEPPPPCAETTLQVDLTWTGVGDITREGSNFHFRSDGFIVNGRFSGTRRSAEANGTIIEGATDLTGGTTGFGSIFNARSGEVVID